LVASQELGTETKVGMDIPKSAKRRKMIRRGLIATVGLVVVAAVTVRVSRPAARRVDRACNG
jgi:hypothetical protein